MRLFIIIFLTAISTVSLITLAFSFYEHDAALRDYKHAVFGMREEYQNLLTQYEDYQTKVKNLRQVTVFATSASSKNIEVSNIINKHAKNVTGDLSIYFKNLSTDESVVVDTDKTYYMASLYKVILTLYILEQVKDGKVALSDKIDDITIEEALNKIITESNNEYAIALAEKYGWENIEAAMKQKLGIDFSFTNDLIANTHNMGILFEDIALSLKITNVESQYLLKLLNEQTRTNKLPKYLPKTIYTHNKTGEYGTFSHDAGIFYTPKANYILIYMSDTKSPATTDEEMALMSQEIYEALNETSTSPISKN